MLWSKPQANDNESITKDSGPQIIINGLRSSNSNISMKLVNQKKTGKQKLRFFYTKKKKQRIFFSLWLEKM